MTSLPTRFAALLLMTATAGCTTPDLSAQLTDSASLVASAKESQNDRLTAAAATELAAAERVKAQANQRIVELPPGCVAIMADLSRSAERCAVVSTAVPLSAPVNATQLLLAYNSLENYFAALQSLAQSNAPEEIEAKSRQLLQAIGDLADTNNLTSLARLQTRISEKGGVAADAAGFLANQARQRALRRVMSRADPVIAELVASMQFKILDEGDSVAETRLAVLDAFDAYNTAVRSKDSAAQLTSAKTLRTAVANMQKQEKVSPLRKLYLARALHGAMLARLTGTQDFDDVEALLIEVTDILIALEDA